MTDWTQVEPGAKLRCIKGFQESGGVSRLTVGKEYTLKAYTRPRPISGYPGSIVIEECDKGVNSVSWSDSVTKDGSEHFELVQELPVLTLNALIHIYEAERSKYNRAAEALANAEDDLYAVEQLLIQRLNLEVL